MKISFLNHQHIPADHKEGSGNEWAGDNDVCGLGAISNLINPSINQSLCYSVEFLSQEQVKLFSRELEHLTDLIDGKQYTKGGPTYLPAVLNVKNRLTYILDNKTKPIEEIFKPYELDTTKSGHPQYKNMELFLNTEEAQGNVFRNGWCVMPLSEYRERLNNKQNMDHSTDTESNTSKFK